MHPRKTHSIVLDIEPTLHTAGQQGCGQVQLGHERLLLPHRQDPEDSAP
jgi:hypothetical protein